jgi:hypothetical protein
VDQSFYEDEILPLSEPGDLLLGLGAEAESGE